MASIFAGLETDTIAMPSDEGQTATIRSLSGKQLRKAARLRMKARMAEFQEMGGAEIGRTLAEMATAKVGTDAPAPPAAVDPLDAYDADSIIADGLAAWTYGDVTSERREALKDEPRTFIATAILKLSRPELFQTAREHEAAQKNG